MKKIIICFCCFFILLVSCTFDYGETGAQERETPDLIMDNVEYVRVRSADPIARFNARHAERYERQGLMKLREFTFEQYENRGTETNAFGRAGNALVYLESGDVLMDMGVKLEVVSEEIIIETNQLEWKDTPRLLTSGAEDEVNISKEDGTNFVGIGLTADARRRTWEFAGRVNGTYVYEEEEETSGESTGDTE
ncbi:MAG: LPS export ABC transporter periplasmic protein LptC [Treponema sp.]|nr:LPS export ABC transporter periplasmic protein LptC [Treponema sp.]